MNVLCLECGEVFEDLGDSQYAICPGCGREVRSRGWSGRRPEARVPGPSERQYHGPPQDHTPPGRYHPPPEYRPSGPGYHQGPPDHGPMRQPLYGPGPGQVPPDRYLDPRYSYGPMSQPATVLEIFFKGLHNLSNLTVLLFLVLLMSIHVPFLIYGLAVVPGNLFTSSYTVHLFLPTAVGIGTLTGTALQIYYGLIVAAIMASVVWAFKVDVPDFVRRLRDGMQWPASRIREVSSNSIVQVTQILLVYFFLSVIYSLMLTAAGVRQETPFDGDKIETWKLMFVLANASVFEEVQFRIVLLALPLLVVHLVIRYKGIRPINYLIGGGFELGFFEIVLMGSSAFMFAMAHVTHGWDIWKFPPTFFVGLIFGYLFLRRGIYAAILLHFAIDYLNMSVIVTGDTSGISLFYIMLFASIMIFSIVLAPFYIYQYGKEVLKKVKGMNPWAYTGGG